MRLLGIEQKSHFVLAKTQFQKPIMHIFDVFNEGLFEVHSADIKEDLALLFWADSPIGEDLFEHLMRVEKEGWGER